MASATTPVLRSSLRGRASAPPTAAVLGWGSALPAYRYDQAELAAFLASELPAPAARRLRAAFRGSGVESRCSVLPDFAAGCREPVLFAPGRDPTTAERLAVYAWEAPKLAARAAEAALGRARVAAARITHLLFVTCTGFVAPGPDLDLAERLGLGDDVHRTQIGFQGCSAGVVALRSAAEIVRGDRYAVVLVVTCELSSLHFQCHLNEADLRGHALFADGAAACVVGAGDPAGPAAGARILLGRAMSRTLPNSRGDMAWAIGQTGFRMALSSRVPEALAAALPSVRETLAGDAPVRHWAVHPGGPSILRQVAGVLELPPEALEDSRAVLRSAGNLSSATILCVLERMAALEVPGEGLALAFGPGLVAEGIAFRVESGGA